MHITKVILEGFKSYGERTVMGPFHQGHNVVVGRNGSGKSNFFSAIEFVLLADSFTLKAEQQRAVLHEGSGPRPITASVEIVFDNKDRLVPQKSYCQICVSWFNLTCLDCLQIHLLH